MNTNALDLSTITSNDKLIETVTQGMLFKVFVCPLELGGVDNKSNVLFVPQIAAEMMDKLSGLLIELARKGLIKRLNVHPEYKGESHVPSKIIIVAGHENGINVLNLSIDIW